MHKGYWSKVVSSSGFKTAYSSRLGFVSRIGDAFLVGLALVGVAQLYDVQWSDKYSLIG